MASFDREHPFISGAVHLLALGIKLYTFYEGILFLKSANRYINLQIEKSSEVQD